MLDTNSSLSYPPTIEVCTCCDNVTWEQNGRGFKAQNSPDKILTVCPPCQKRLMR